MRIAHRRPLAVLIRVRQEIRKRLGGSPPLAVGDSAEVWSNEAAVNLAGLPLAVALAARNRNECPGAPEIQSEAARIRNGDWSVFGTPFRPGRPSTTVWAAHPLSGKQLELKPWPRLRYLDGELGGDVKYVWELNRHNQLLRLAQDWFLAHNVDSANALAVWLDEWMEGNPPGWGINWASSLEVAYRAIAWCWIAALTADAPIWTEARRSRFFWGLWHHGRHIERFDSVHHSPNTHLTGEALGLFYLGSCVPGFRHAGRWRGFGLATLREELRHQVLPDGMHFERSTCYHRYTAEILLHAVALARLVGMKAEVTALEPAAERAAGVLAELGRPDGSLPVLGDEDGGRVVGLSTADAGDPSPLLALASSLFDASYGVEGGEDLAWWLTGQTRTTPGPAVAPGLLRVSLGAAGYFGARERRSAEPWYCLVDGGPHGGDRTGHAHDDGSHVEIARGALRLSVDPGSSTYTGDPERREWERSAAAHATLLLESRVTAQSRGPFGWATVPPDPETVTDATSPYWACRVQRRWAGGAPAVHERQVVLLPTRGVLVCDWLHGAAGEAVRVTWPLGSQPEVPRLEGRRVQVGEGAAVGWSWQGLEAARAQLAPHRFAPSFGRSEAGTALLLRGTAQQAAALVTVFLEGRAVPRFSWQAESVEVATNGWRVEFRPGSAPTVASSETPGS